MFTIRTKNLAALSGVLLFAASCGQNTTSEETTTADTTTTEVTVAAPITLTDVQGSPEFPNASLTLASATAAKEGADSAKVTFNFAVKNYELKMQTADTGSKQCNNSDKGQHIHFILDNAPYKALYEPKNEMNLPLNSEHYLMAFLSRSYHESVKSKGAAIVYHFKIDGSGKLVKLDEPKTPMVFYSRPKGDYLGKDTKNVLFDFYVWNATLSADGYKVKADISADGKDTSFTVTDWKAQFIHGLPMGKSSVKLTLVDKDNNKVDGPETEVERSFNLAESEPMAK